jgi:hypothetical protein
MEDMEGGFLASKTGRKTTTTHFHTDLHHFNNTQTGLFFETGQFEFLSYLRQGC